MDATIKTWANEVLDFFENNEFQTVREDDSFYLTAPAIEDSPFLINATENGIALYHFRSIPNISYQEINQINTDSFLL